MLKFLRIVSIIAFSIAPIWAESSAAKTYECKAVDAKARVGARDRDVVSVNGNISDKICTFSVNGVSAGSPPQPEIDGAFRVLFDGAALFRGVIDLRSLATAMLAAGPDTSADELEAVFRATEDRVQDCFKRARESDFSDEWGGSNGPQFCMVANPERPDSNVIAFGPFMMTYHPNDRARTLGFFVVRDSLINGIFVPIE